MSERLLGFWNFFIPPFLILIIFVSLIGCASRPPTIAHTHIGHALDGWHDTPEQMGLLPTAEQAAQKAIVAAENASRTGVSLKAIQAEVQRLLSATDPVNDPDVSDEIKYGVKNALESAVNHIEFAAISPDASDNVKVSAAKLKQEAKHILDRSELIVALGSDIFASTSKQEASALAKELLKLARANLRGDDSNGDGVIGSSAEEYGLKQIRGEIEGIINRENPAYASVERWYLFNLVRLPSGEWVFQKLGTNKPIKKGAKKDSAYY